MAMKTIHSESDISYGISPLAKVASALWEHSESMKYLERLIFGAYGIPNSMLRLTYLAPCYYKHTFVYTYSINCECKHCAKMRLIGVKKLIGTHLYLNDKERAGNVEKAIRLWKESYLGG